MKNTFGQSIALTVFGESHGDCVVLFWTEFVRGLTSTMPILKRLFYVVRQRMRSTLKGEKGTNLR